ncbi:MAG: D-alanyl-D-alanine carboxypeptidase family protein [Ruminococcaceae bacterium]|nr:D-alanyl-D-alanine carboxypeptidase family protein [Oscillospiraceae bacterium]
MTNGTRIDPEEREPRAIKIKQPKRTGRKIVLAVLSVILLIAIGGGVFAFIEYGGELELPFVSEKTEETEQKPEEPSVPSEPEIPEENEPEPVVPEIPEESEPEEPVVPEEPVEPEPEEPEIPRDEWFMLLVNRENPLPEDFSVETVVIDDQNHTVDARIAADLSALIAAGESEGLDFVFYTAFRSVEKQNELFREGKTDVPGGSGEHNTGLAVDIGCAKGNFVGSPEEKWLLEHAHEFGFILRYPADKTEITGFAHEPWHFRYVGREQAKLIFESGLCLEEYLAQ